MRVLRLFSLVVLAACKRDLDGDGQSDESDCDDQNSAIFLGAVETCNGADDDCDGFVDEGVSTTAFWDRDGDGYGDDAFVSRVCTVPADAATVGGDCDDRDSDISPDGIESCNAADDDCNGAIDDVSGIVYFQDADGDGHGGGTPTDGGCVPGKGQTLLNDDCNDTEPLAWDGAVEVCDGVDNDCNGTVDDGAPLVRVWEDLDNDGYGDPTRPAVGCGTSAGISDNALDCDDGDLAVNPDALDVQGNGLDEDCDGYVDEYGVPTPYATLDDAILAAPDGAVVQLDAGTFFGTVDLTGRDLTLAGEGCDRTTLYGDAAGSVVSLDAGRVEHLTLSGGLGTPGADLVAHGGGVYATGSATVSDVCFVGNDVTGNGAGAAVVAGTLTIEDSTFDRNFAGAAGGGAWAGPGSGLVIVRSVFTANSALGLFEGGGALATHGGSMEASASTFAGNIAADDGGAVLVTHATDTSVVPELYTPGAATLRHCTFHANAVTGPSGGPRGQAIFNEASDLVVESSVFTGHAGTAKVIEDHPVGTATDGNLLSPVWNWSELLFWDNATLDNELFYLWDALHDEVRYVQDDPSLAASLWDLRLLPGSTGIDIGLDLDLDGSPGDLGAFGGPDADQTGTQSYLGDQDNDGLEDGWEIWGGTNVWIADASSDDDGDGDDAAAERAADSDPRLPDTDADGVADDADLAPRNPSDNSPFSDAGLDRWAWVDTTVTLDGSASWDPNGDALSWSWSLAVPGGSVLAVLSAPAEAITSFIPDVAGTYTVTLTVSDGTVSHVDTLLVEVGSGVRVPEDAPTLQAAVDLATDGGYVGVAPGTWIGVAVLGGKDLTILGLGDDPSETVIDGAGVGLVLSAEEGENLTLANLTVTGGNGGTTGGAVGSDGGELTLSRVIIRDNVANTGGGVRSIAGTLVITDSIIERNTAAIDGGGVYTLDSDVTVRNVSFLANTADGSGGGISVDTSSGITYRYYDFSNTLWQDNYAAVFGSALYTPEYYSVGTFTLMNSAFVGQTGLRTIHMNDGTMQLISTTFWDDACTTAIVTGTQAEVPEFTTHGVTTGTPATRFWGTVVEYWPSEIPIVDPGFARYLNDGVFDDLPFNGPSSPLIDAGMALFQDADGTRADAGLAGGPDAPRYLARFARDDDQDGMSDGWEVWFGLDPTSDDANGDADGDAVDNLSEYLAQTIP